MTTIEPTTFHVRGERQYYANHAALIFGFTVIAIVIAVTIYTAENIAYGFHENLGIDDNKATELYNANPNDPAIMRWKNSLQSAIDTIPSYGHCFDIPHTKDCKPFFSSIIDICKSHPNTLLGCNDSRLEKFTLALKNAPPIPPSKLDEYATSIFDKCFGAPNSNITLELVSSPCHFEIPELMGDCLKNISHAYCDDRRFLDYLRQMVQGSDSK